MNKKVIFFSIDRLGDYLIRSNTIKQISDKYNYSEIVCSENNYKLISTQFFFTKVVIFKNKFKFINKLRFIFLYILRSYDACIVFDGKSISLLLIFIIKAKFKFCFLYKKKGIINYIKRHLLVFFFILFNIKFKYLYSRKLIEEKKYLENYPQKYKILNKYFQNNNTQTYYLDDINVNKFKQINHRYILIHLDEKFNDIKNINNFFNESLIELQKKTGKLIFLTTFNNNFEYYKKLAFPKIEQTKLNEILTLCPKILILEDLPLVDLQCLIKYSFINISCHAGFIVHTSLSFEKKTIDIINEADQIWFDAWVTKNNNYKIVLKSFNNKPIDIKIILETVSNEIF